MDRPEFQQAKRSIAMSVYHIPEKHLHSRGTSLQDLQVVVNSLQVLYDILNFTVSYERILAFTNH